MLKEVWEWVRAIIIAVVVALLFRMFVMEHFLVEGESMIPTLNNSERIIVNKMVYHFSNPEQGDIVVFNYQGRRDFIKRAVGVEGDTIQIIDNKLYRNGLPVNESYLKNGAMQDYGPVTSTRNTYLFLATIAPTAGIAVIPMWDLSLWKKSRGAPASFSGPWIVSDV